MAAIDDAGGLDGMIEKASTVFANNPGNRCVKYLLELHNAGKLSQLQGPDLDKLYLCAKTGIANEDSGLGCYAMSPADYDDLSFFFDLVCNDYHSNPGNKIHTTDWSLEGVEGLPEDGLLDLKRLGITNEVSMRVRVGRNLTSFPLPGAMAKEDRIQFEKVMLEAFAKLIANETYGGRVYSLTPHEEWKAVTGEETNPHFITHEKYQQLVDAHIMFKDMAADPYLASAGIASDWPCGRGCYQSSDGGFIVWFGEEDQLRIMCMAKGFILNPVFDRLNEALKTMESIEGIEFATSEKYGYVTSCPSNLGTGMRASIQIPMPGLTKDGTDSAAKEAAKPLGLSVRGIGGEHTPIGTDGTIDISPSKRLFITEAEIITALYNGIKELLKLENTAIGRDINAQPGVNEVVLQEQAKTGEALLQETADEVAIENGEAQVDVSKDEIVSSSILDINSDRIMDSNDIIAALDTDDDGNLSAVDMVPSVVSDLVNEVIESKQEGAIESKSDPMDAKVNVLPSNVPEVAQFSNEVVADAGEKTPLADLSAQMENDRDPELKETTRTIPPSATTEEKSVLEYLATKVDPIFQPLLRKIIAAVGSLCS